MNRRFPLDGLLRIRRLQEDRAAADLVVARGRSDETEARMRLTRIVLGESAVDAPASTAALHAVAAARASSSVMLTELGALASLQQAETDAATDALVDARIRAAAVEKLSDKHREAVHEHDLRTEQSVIDEIAGSASVRGGRR